MLYETELFLHITNKKGLWLEWVDPVKKKLFRLSYIPDHGYLKKTKGNVSDPDPDWIRIQMVQPIRIRIGITDPDPGRA
jgi:hypothetical protein